MPPLNGASVVSGGTEAPPTGGSAITFATAGIQANSNTLNCNEDADLRTRRQMVVTIKEPKVSASAPNGYTQARASVTFKTPLELENGNITVNTVRVEVAYDVETSASELADLKMVSRQILSDSDFDNLFADLSLA